MTLRSIFKYRNLDSTSDFNSRNAKIISRGIYEGGLLSIPAVALQVSVPAFTALSYDGMVVENTTTNTTLNVNPNTVSSLVNIASSTNTSPIQVTTSTAHGLVDNTTAIIAGHAVNTAANGRWVITRIDAYNFTLNGSTGNGTGVSTGTVGACIIYYLACYAKYNPTGDPDIRLEVFPSSTWNGIDHNYFITFARLAIPPSAGILAAVNIDYSDSDYAEPAGKSTWRSSVASLVDLPTVGNRNNDLRFVTDTGDFYYWDSALSTWNVYNVNSISINYSNAGAWADSTVYSPNTTTKAQFDKILVDLSTGDGVGKLHTNAIAGSPTTITAGTLTSALTTLLSGVNTRGAVATVNTWAEAQTFSKKIVLSPNAPVAANGAVYTDGSNVLRTYLTDLVTSRIVAEPRNTSRTFMYPPSSMTSSQVVSGTPAYPRMWALDYQGFWSTYKGSIYDRLYLIASLNRFIQIGCKIVSFEIYCTPGQSRTGSDRMRASLRLLTKTGTIPVSTVYSSYDDGTTNLNILTIAVPASWVTAGKDIISNDDHCIINLASGVGDTINDTVTCVRVTYEEGNYLSPA